MKLAIIALIALSVSKLELALKEDEYTVEEILEAMAAEKEGQNRSTALEALEDALPEPEPEPEPAYTLAQGKAITTKRGILSSGQPITAKDLSGGQDVLDKFVTKGLVVKA
jgi:Asp-tRNA(Asn)/Glu-tRNA(Gln) amidotransferase A subunit family amidase